jgi:transcriptional regulator with XRE-family HTH domain
MNGEQNIIKTVGGNIRELRIRSGWSLRVAARRLGISTSALSKIETGVTDVNLSRLEQIADVYGVKLIQLWIPDFEFSELQTVKLNQAKEKVSNLETEIKAFQRKVILLYEKLHEQTASKYNRAV